MIGENKLFGKDNEVMSIYVLLSLSWNYLVAVLFNIGLRYVVFWQFDRISWSYEHNFVTELNQTPTHLKYQALKTSPFTSCGSHPSMHLSCTVCGNNTVTLSQCALIRCIEPCRTCYFQKVSSNITIFQNLGTCLSSLSMLGHVQAYTLINSKHIHAWLFCMTNILQPCSIENKMWVADFAANRGHSPPIFFTSFRIFS